MAVIVGGTGNSVNTAQRGGRKGSTQAYAGVGVSASLRSRRGGPSAILTLLNFDA